MTMNAEILAARRSVLEASGHGMPVDENTQRMAEMELDMGENPAEPEIVHVPDAIDPTDKTPTDQAHLIDAMDKGLVAPGGFKSFSNPAEIGKLEDNMSFHPARGGGEAAARHDQIRGLCLAMGKELSHLLPPGRHKSLAFTALEETMHWSNAAIAVADLDHVTG